MAKKIKKNSFKSKKRADRIASIFAFLVIVLFAALTVLPLFWMVRSSLLEDKILYLYPPKFFPKEMTLENYQTLGTAFPYFKLLKNTFMLITPAVVGGTLTAILSGYAFARLRFKGKKFIFSLCIASMLVPYVVTMIPLYVMFVKYMGLGHGSYLPLIIPYFCGGGMFNIFLIRQFMLTIPKELDEAAMIDGASRMRTLWSILVPSISSAIIVVALLLFVTNWNDVLGPMIYLSASKDKWPFAIALNTFKGSFGIEWGRMMAAATLSVLPGVLIYLICQRYFIEGIVMTGMKN